MTKMVDFLNGAIIDSIVQAGLRTRCCCKVVHHCDAQPCTAGGLANSSCPGDSCIGVKRKSHAVGNLSIMDNTQQPRFLPEILEANA